MSPDRGDRVARPPESPQWEFRHLSKSVGREWEQLCNQLPEAARDAYDLIIDQPQPHTSRHHPLHGDLATRTVKGRDLNRWQHELTSGARLWFLLDPADRLAWLEQIHFGHPKATE